jgi:gluconate kinase
MMSENAPKQAKAVRPLPSVVIVMGVSGSGKSTIGSLLAGRLQWEFEDGDWFHPAANVEKMHTDRAAAAWILAIRGHDHRFTRSARA